MPSIAELRKHAQHLMQASSLQESADRRPLYEDVEALLNPGFLTHGVEVDGVLLQLRTLGPGDLFLLRSRVGGSRHLVEWVIASALWMVDGQSLLGAPNGAYHAHQRVRSFSPALLDLLLSVYQGLYDRMIRAVSRVEAYCYEPYARSAWKMTGGVLPCMEAITGVGGTGSLGLNGLQRLWVAHQQAEDQREIWQREWDAAKLVAMAHNPKGIKKLQAAEDSRKDLETERRQGVIQDMVYATTGRQIQREGSIVVLQAVSAQDLIDEMDRARRGEKDFHDLAVDAYKEQVRARMEQDRQAHIQRMEALEEATGSNVVAYMTQEEMLAYQKTQNHRRVVVEGTPSGALYERYIAKDTPIGGLSLTKEGVVARPMPPLGETLASQLEGRQPTYKDE